MIDPKIKITLSKICFCPRLNTDSKSSASGSIFSQANPNTLYGSIFKNNMDDSSFSNNYDSLIKTITLPRQAATGLQEDISANSVVACKVSL